MFFIEVNSEVKTEKVMSLLHHKGFYCSYFDIYD